MVPGFLWDVLTDQLYKSADKVGSHVLVKRRVKPDDFPTSLASIYSGGWFKLNW